jgi:hypothetical protein
MSTFADSEPTLHEQDQAIPAAKDSRHIPGAAINVRPETHVNNVADRKSAREASGG